MIGLSIRFGLTVVEELVYPFREIRRVNGSADTRVVVALER